MRRSQAALLRPDSEIARHYHAHPYATIVLSGSYEEAGDAGRWRVEAGDVLLHAPFSAHRDWVAKRRTHVLDLPLPLDGREWPGRGRIADPGMLLRVAERDVIEAASLLLEAFEPVEGAMDDVPDRLAAALTGEAAPAIAQWAERHGWARETASRHFSMIYGVAPARYRGEARARRAWRLIVGGEAALADVAAEAGYADQAHMSRAVKALTGHSPGQWRTWRTAGSHSFKT
ncbi:MAG TPA: AraC family transcriptional regulator [Allosphingosinicella sp.]